MTQQTVNDLRDIFNSQITSWVKLVIGIIVFTFGIVTPFYAMKQDLALVQQSIRTIESNHYKHIEDINVQLKEQNTQISELQKQLWIIANQ